MTADAPDAGRTWTRRSALGLAGILLLAAALRTAHLLQLRVHDPFYDIPNLDGRLYDAWARAIVAGETFHEGVLFQGPLYPYFIAGVYAVFGADAGPPAVKAVQVLLGTLSVGLVGLLARELFDRRVALVASGIAALYGMLVFYGGTILVVNVQVPLVLTALWLAIRALHEPTPLRWLGLGGIVGLSVLARQTTLAFGLGLLLWLGISQARHLAPRRLAGCAAVFLAALALPIAPFTLHNYRASGEFVLLNSMGGPNFYMGNNPSSDGTWVLPPLGKRIDNPLAMSTAFEAIAERSEGRELGPNAVSRFWFERTRQFIAEDPARWLALEARKALLFVNAREVWSNRSIEVSRDFSWVLRLPLLGFGIVLPLAVLGVAYSRRQWHGLVPLYGLVATYLLFALLFFVVSRYRMPMVLVLMVFAAVGAVGLYDRVRQKAWIPVAASVVALGAATALAHVYTGRTSLHMAYYNLGNKFAELGRDEEAVASFEKSVTIRPAFISNHNNLGLAFERLDRRDEAIAAWQRVHDLALAGRDGRRYQRAVRHLRALGAPPDPPSRQDE